MSGPVVEASQLVLFPIAAAGIGALIAVWRRVGDTASGFIQHFAGGVVFAAVAGEVLPSLRDQHSLRAVVVGFSIGVAVVVALGSYERRVEAKDTVKRGCWRSVLPRCCIS